MLKLDATKYVQRAVDLAGAADEAGTFAVGGLLMDHEGFILKEVHNNVIRDGRISDPTAHGERQLITWYYEALRSNRRLPSPSELTIITSLDPCLMCTGAILQAGINVIVIANDDIGGINWKRDNSFLVVPEPLRQTAVQQFAYFGVDDGSRHFVGSTRSLFANAVVSASHVRQSFETAKHSIENVRKIHRQGSTPALNGKDGQEPALIQLLRSHYARSMELQIDIAKAADRARLLSELLEAARTSKADGGSFDSAALIDQFQNVLFVFGSSPLANSPIETPLMRLAQVYTSCRSSQKESGFLSHPSKCSIVLLHGPSPSALGLMDLGIFGLTLGPSETPQNLYYFRPVQSKESLAAMIRNLPPVFRDVMKITPVELGEV